MVKYSVDAVVTLLAPIDAIPGRPTFGTLWKLSTALYVALRKIDHPAHPDTGYAGYMMPTNSFRLYSTTPWQDPASVGEFFTVPRGAITNTDQDTAKNRWQAQYDRYETFTNVRTALKSFFERVIDQAYHTSGNNAILGQSGFGTDDPPAILSKLRTLYGRPTFHETEQYLLRLLAPMDRTLPVEVMIRDMEEVQLFLAANPDGQQELTEPNLIQYASIKLAKTGLYAKALEKWHVKPHEDRRAWQTFRAHMISEYERMLAEAGGSTFGQEGYGTAYNSMEAADDTASLTESIVQYAERASMAESKVSELESRLSAIELAANAKHAQKLVWIARQDWGL